MRRTNGHGNFPGQGRPPAPFEGFYSTHEHDHVGDVITPRLRVWVEGEVIIEDVDDAGKLVLSKLGVFARDLSERRDATGVPFKNSTLTIRSQRLPSEGTMPRRQSPSMKGRRRPIDEVCRYVERYPGHTLDQLVKYFYGELSDVDLPKARSSMNTAVYRAMQKKGIVRKYDEHGVIHYYAPGDLNVGVVNDARLRAIAGAIAFIRDGKTDFESVRAHYLEAQAIADVIDHNAGRPADAWVSPPRDGEERPF